MAYENRCFQELAAKYQILIFDVIGVIHNGLTAYPHAVEAINNLLAHQTVIFLSNMPRPGIQTYEKLQSLGINRPFDVLTSGHVTRHELTTTYAGQKVFHWGKDRNQDITRNLKLNLVDTIEQAEIVLLSAYILPDEDETAHEEIIEKILHHNLPVLCSNPDKTAIYEDTIRKCAGSLAHKIFIKGGNVKFMGKPAPLIYEKILQQFPHCNPSDMLMIGDTLETDIMGAIHVSMDSLLVLTGNTARDLKTANQSLEDYLHAKDWGQYMPTYYKNDLR